MTPEERAKARCYVAMYGEDAASAACVIDGTSEKTQREFLLECVGRPIRIVTVAEARRLLENYPSEPEQLDLVKAIEAAS